MVYCYSSRNGHGLPAVQLLVERGADAAVRLKLPRHYARAAEIVERTPLGDARLFPGVENRATTYLRERGGLEWARSVGSGGAVFCVALNG